MKFEWKFAEKVFRVKVQGHDRTACYNGGIHSVWCGSLVVTLCKLG